MNSATEFDVGPLTWVRSEIDLALGRADDALLQYTASVTAGVGDLSQIKFCRSHLHQVQGALTIVGLDGYGLTIEGQRHFASLLPSGRVAGGDGEWSDEGTEP